MIRELWTLGILLGGSVMDIRKKALPVAFLLFAAAGSLLVSLVQGTDGKTLLLGLIPGAVLLLLGRWTGCVGPADGILLALLGGMLGLHEGGELLMYALLLAAVAAIVLIALGKAGRKSSLPFVPFLLAAYLLLEWRIYWMGGAG